MKSVISEEVLMIAGLLWMVSERVAVRAGFPFRNPKLAWIYWEIFGLSFITFLHTSVFIIADFQAKVRGTNRVLSVDLLSLGYDVIVLF